MTSCPASTRAPHAWSWRRCRRRSGRSSSGWCWQRRWRRMCRSWSRPAARSRRSRARTRRISPPATGSGWPTCWHVSSREPATHRSPSAWRPSRRPLRPRGCARRTTASSRIDRRYPPRRMSDRHAGYETDRPDIQAHVPTAARSILELGCSAGALGAALKDRAPEPVTVVGVELDADHAQTAAQRLDRVVVGDAEGFLAGPWPPEAPFDCLIAADVLEHLVDPWSALSRAVALVRPGGTVIVSVPNVLFFGALLRVLRER